MEIKNKYNIGDTVYYGFGQRDDDNRYYEEPFAGKILGILVEDQEVKYSVQTKYISGNPYFKTEDEIFKSFDDYISAREDSLEFYCKRLEEELNAKDHCASYSKQNDLFEKVYRAAHRFGKMVRVMVEDQLEQLTKANNQPRAASPVSLDELTDEEKKRFEEFEQNLEEFKQKTKERELKAGSSNAKLNLQSDKFDEDLTISSADIEETEDLVKKLYIKLMKRERISKEQLTSSNKQSRTIQLVVADELTDEAKAKLEELKHEIKEKEFKTDCSNTDLYLHPGDFDECYIPSTADVKESEDRRIIVMGD